MMTSSAHREYDERAVHEAARLLGQQVYHRGALFPRNKKRPLGISWSFGETLVRARGHTVAMESEMLVHFFLPTAVSPKKAPAFDREMQHDKRAKERVEEKKKRTKNHRHHHQKRGSSRRDGESCTACWARLNSRIVLLAKPGMTFLLL